MQVDLSNPSGIVWRPDAATVEAANLTRFMRVLGVESFEALNERASRDPAWFHDALIRFLDYRFERPYERVLDLKLMRRVVRSAWLGEEAGDLSTLVNPEAVQAIPAARR